MGVGTSDLHAAIFAAWEASSLPAAFAALGGVEPTLAEGNAAPGQEAPYCIVEYRAAAIQTRMTVGTNQQRWIRNASVSFHVMAEEIDGDSRGPKAIALSLAEDLMKVFGGHPDTNPTATITLENGNHLITRYMDDRGVRENDVKYQWTIDYDFVLDVPARG
jgi:hypothetical protein